MLKAAAYISPIIMRTPRMLSYGRRFFLQKASWKQFGHVGKSSVPRILLWRWRFWPDNPSGEPFGGCDCRSQLDEI